MALPEHAKDDDTGTCPVCRITSNGNFMGIEACRACAIFFRRAKNSSRELKCRSDTGQCTLDRKNTFACKKCRYERIQELVQAQLQGEEYNPDAPCSSISSQSSANERVYLEELVPMHVGPILQRFRQCYNEACRKRLIIDFGSLENLPVDENGLIAAQAFHSTSSPISVTKRIYGVLHQFLTAASDDYAMLRPELQEALFINFSRVWYTFETSYRSWKHFPDNPQRIFLSYGRFVDLGSIDRFYSDMPDHEYKTEAIWITEENSTRGRDIWLPAITRLQPTYEEFIGITAYLLWNISGKSVPEELIRVAERNKKNVLHELHQYYSSQGLANYAGRLGEVFMFLSVLEGLAESLSEFFGVFKLLDIIDDETYNFASLNIK